MVYSKKFVLSVLVDGQPQKELANGTVKIPFGEYAVRLRNRNDRRAVAQIYLDGENVSGNGYIIKANDYVDIKRWNEIDKAFKFVPLDSGEAVDFGKNGPNEDKQKGVIEVRFFLEKETPKVEHIHHHHHHDYWHRPLRRTPSPWNPSPYSPVWMCAAGGSNESYSGTRSGKLESLSKTCSIGDVSMGDTQTDFNPEGVTLSMNACSAAPAPIVEDGCTVQGKSTGQSWTSQYIDIEDSYVSLKVFLQGYNEEPKVQTVKKKTNKDKIVDDLEAENEELKKQIAKLENEKLKKQLEDLKK